MIMAYDASVSVVNLFDSKQISVLDTTKVLQNGVKGRNGDSDYYGDIQSQKITSLAYSEAEKRIYTGSADCRISMWNLNLHTNSAASNQRN